MKINRKAILDVDIPKACRTITEPEAPMALRLQSNLLSVIPDEFVDLAADSNLVC